MSRSYAESDAFHSTRNVEAKNSINIIALTVDVSV